MSGHNSTPCVLCDCWNETHHSRYHTTPVQPAEAELMMIRGFRVGLKPENWSGGALLCEKHAAVVEALDQMERPAPSPTPELYSGGRVESVDEMLPSKIPIPAQQPVFGQPASVPCPQCGAAIGSLCKTENDWGFHQVRHEAASPTQGSKVEGVGTIIPGP